MYIYIYIYIYKAFNFHTMGTPGFCKNPQIK